MHLFFERREQLSAEITTFWFRPDQKLNYLAGQFIEITLPHTADDRGQRRWFTLSSSPTDELIAITTRLLSEPSSFKKYLNSLKPGDTVHASHPMGDFVLPRDRAIPLLFIAIGIGITPIKSILSYLVAEHEARAVRILYAAKTEQDLVFLDLVTRIDPEASLYVSRPIEAGTSPQKITTQNVIDAARKLEDPYIYMSGPEEAVEILFTELREAGIKDSRLVTDYFQGYGEL